MHASVLPLHILYSCIFQTWSCRKVLCTTLCDAFLAFACAVCLEANRHCSLLWAHRLYTNFSLLLSMTNHWLWSMSVNVFLFETRSLLLTAIILLGFPLIHCHGVNFINNTHLCWWSLLMVRSTIFEMISIFFLNTFKDSCLDGVAIK